MREPLIVTPSDLYGFRECRRQWYLSQFRSLVPNVPQPYFWFGHGMHAALGAFFTSGKDEEAMLDVYRRWYVSSTRELSEEFGDLWANMSQSYFETYMEGLEMLQNYVVYDAESGIVFEPPYIVEIRERVPILDPYGNETEDLFSFMMDLRCIDGENGDDIVDHKTYKQKWSTGEVLDIDEQMTGYGYGFLRLYGRLPRRIIYDVLMKKVPHAPEVNMNGQLSRNKQQRTTYHHYRKELQRRNLSEHAYSEVLEYYKQKGWSDYFYREVSYRNETQLINYERRLYTITQEMHKAIEDPEQFAYPSPGAMRCGGCPFLGVCHAMEDGGDYNVLIENRYKVEPREK